MYAKRRFDHPSQINPIPAKPTAAPRYPRTTQMLAFAAHRLMSFVSATLLLAVSALAFAGMANAATWTVTTTGDDAAPGTSCNSGNSCLTLRDAIFSAANGDTIVFNLSGYTLPATINLTNAAPLTTNKSLTIDGPGYDKLSISGQTASRVIYLPDNVPMGTLLVIDRLTIRGGAMIGTAGANATTPGGSGLAGQTVEGGCIYVGGNGTLQLDFDVVSGCIALGGVGGSGAAGAVGSAGDNAPNNNTGATGGVGNFGGNGGSGGNGGGGHGGAIVAYGALLVDSSTFRGNTASGGAGGDAGVGGTGGTGGSGGNGHCTQLPGGPCVFVGPGGAGGAGGVGGSGGTGGVEGTAAGGAIYAAGPVTMTNTTLSDNTAIAGIFGQTGGKGGAYGNGGSGGTGGPGTSTGPTGANGNSGTGGVGGNGGNALGGAYFTFNPDSSHGSQLKHASIAFNSAYGGFAGLGMNGSGAGLDGAGFGAGVSNNGALTVWNSVVASNLAYNPIDGTTQTTTVVRNCHILTALTLTNDSLDDDPSGAPSADTCGFDTHGSPNFAPPTSGNNAYPWGGNGMPVLMPLAPSPVIGGAAVHGTVPSYTGGCAVPVDARGVQRPQGHNVPVGGGGFYFLPAACDLGAVQNDIIFRDGFDQ